MKRLVSILLAWSPLFAQNAIINNPVIGQVYYVQTNLFLGKPGFSSRDILVFQIIRNPDGSKTFFFTLFDCTTSEAFELHGPSPADAKPVLVSKTECHPYSESLAEVVGNVEPQIGLFLDSYGDVLHRLVYGRGPLPSTSNSPTNSALAPRFTVAQPTPPGDPYITMLDGFGNSLLQFDMTNFSLLSQVVVPSTVGPYGVRPTLMGPQNEYWVASRSAGIAIANLASQQVTANIATPSVPQAAFPVGIVFTNDGNTAFEAFQYYSPDSSGNNGLLVIFDAVKQAVTSTLPLKYAPSAFVMSPDGLTAYLLSNTGMITYYDVLSGTADLSLSTYTPGQNGGYPGFGTVFVHPDGTRLFWNVGPGLESFDLATHQVTAQFDSGLPTTSGVSMTLSQDGLIAFLSNGAGDEVFLDTQFGGLVGTYTASAAALVFGGPPQP